MTPSPSIVRYVRDIETLRLRAYMPTPKDRPTLGYGCTRRLDGSPVQMGDRCTEAEAEDLFDHWFRLTAATVTGLLGSSMTTPPRFDAMCSLAYNIGTGPKGFAGSAVLRLHRLGKYALAADAFASWRLQAGKALPGLVKRRADEARLYLTGDLRR